MLAAGSILWCCSACSPFLPYESDQHRSIGVWGSVCQHTLPHTANPISLDATLCCNSNTNKAQARLQSTCGPAVSACNELNCDENKTMHRPLLKIPVKYMDTEKAQAEHSAENTTLAVTVISWKVLRRLSCKSICAIYMGEELCWPQLFFFYQTGLSHQSKLCEFTWMSEKKYEVEGSTIWGKMMEHVRRAGGGVSALVSACHTWHIGPELPKVPFWALLLAKALFSHFFEHF